MMPEPKSHPPRERHDRQPPVEYVGAPTEYADAEEVPSWVATLVKAIVLLPTAVAALSVIELVLLALVAALVVLVVLILFVL